MNIICVTVLSGSATVTAHMVLAIVNTDGDDSLLACPAVRRFRLLQLLVLYSEELVVATLVDVLLTDAPRCIVLAKVTSCSMTAQPNKS